MVARSYRLLVWCGVAASLVDLGACVIADPPAALPTVPSQAPEIVRESVVPQVTAILRTWPGEFTIPVLADPTKTIAWEFFIDYDPQSGSYAYVQPGKIDPSASDGGVRVQTLVAPAPAAEGCHTIEFLVAESPGFVNHTPTGSSDSVTWFYTSNDLLNGCQVYVGDSGSDAAADALDGGSG